MGLNWSLPQNLDSAGLPGVAAAGGVYLLMGPDSLVYIGQSTNLLGRLRTHSQFQWGVPLKFSLCQLAAGYSPTQLLEVENDLIAAYFALNKTAPSGQFGQRGNSPVD
jgi:hypothetical protein